LIVRNIAASHQKGVAVWRRFRRPDSADVATGTRNVLDEEVLAGLFSEFLRDQT
jgi:hypothetical protein